MIRRACRISCATGLCWLAMGASEPPGYDVIVVGRTANAPVTEATRDLADRLEATYGTTPDIRWRRLVETGRHILIQAQPEHPAFDQDPLTDEILVERTGRGILIAGSDNTATAIAVYRFIEEFLGWRYYQPGPLGLERLDNPPELPTLNGQPATLLYSKAAFYGRNLSKLRTPWKAPDWSRWQGLRERFSYNHSLHRVVVPSLFDDQPHLFAKDENGQPMRPPYKVPHGYNDHPDLTEPGVRDHVEEWAVQELGKMHAREAGGIASLSLSLGDSFIFGSFDESWPWSPGGYFRRWPDWGNHVFDYTNDLAARLVRHWEQMDRPGASNPPLYIGALSYLNWEKPPRFKVHESIVPYLTYDRTQWYDPAARADDLANIEEWNKAGPIFLGTWDYIFGYGFLVPRSLAAIVAESIPAVHARGVRAYFSQVEPIWPYDLHTTWLTARLLWNPEADTETLLDEFYREFYGPAAGPMRAFFERAEALWMSQSGSGWWLRYWKDPWQAALWNERDGEQMETLLKEALSLAGEVPSGRFQERVRQTSDLFSATALFLRYQDLSWRVQTGSTSMAQEALDTRSALREKMSSILGRHPQAGFAGDLSWIFRYDSLGGAVARAYCAGRAELRPTLADWCRVEGFSGMPTEGPGVPVLHDTTFGKTDNPRIWRQQHLDSDGLAMGSRVDGPGYQARDVRRGSIYQLFRATPGQFYLGELELESAQSPSGEVYIRVDFFDADNQLVAESRRVRLAPTARNGSRQTLRVLMQAPETASHGRLFIRFYEMDPGSRAELFRADVLDLGLDPNP